MYSDKYQVAFDGGPLHGTVREIPKLFPFLTFHEADMQQNTKGIVWRKEKSIDRWLYVLEGRYYRFRGKLKGKDIFE